MKWFKKCGFVDNNTKNLGEELFGTYVWWLWDNNNKIDFNIVAKKVLNHSINLFIEAEKFTKNKWWCRSKLASQHMWYYWTHWRKVKSRIRRGKGGCYCWLFNRHSNIKFYNSFKSCYLPKVVLINVLYWCGRRLIKSGN